MKHRFNVCFLAAVLMAACRLLVNAQAQYWTPDLTFAPVIEANTGLDGVVLGVAYPGGKLLIPSSYSIVNGSNLDGKLARLNNDGTIDSNFQGPEHAAPLRVYADGKILVATSADGYAPYRIKRLLANGSADTGFNGPNLYPSGVYALGTVLLADGRTLIYGDFAKVDDAAQAGLVVLKTDGTVDSAFVSPLATGSNQAVLNHVVQTSDGHILLAGQFYFGGSTVFKKLSRLNLAGTVDTGFNADGVQFDFIPTRLYPQTNGKTLVVDGASKLVRLTSAGARDSTFTPMLAGSVANFGAQKIDGKIFYTTFAYVSSVYSRQLRLMNLDGTDDATFPAISTPYASSYELGLPVLSDDGSYFEGPLTQGRYNLRLAISHVLANGSIDPSFNPRFARSAGVDAYVRQPDGKHLIAASCDYVNNAAMPHVYNVVRLNDNGSIDPAFQISLVHATSVSHLSLQTGGKIIVEGMVTDGNGSTASMIRLNPDGAYDATFQAITQAYGKSAVDNAGYIYLYTNESTPQLRRYTPDGLPDATFQPDALKGIVQSIVPLADGSIIVRCLSSVNSNTQTLARLQHSGSLVTDFADVSDSNVVALAALPDGNIFYCSQSPALDLSTYFTVNRIRPDGVKDYVYVSRKDFNTDMSSDVLLAVAGAAFDLLRTAANGADAQISITLIQGSGQTTLNCRTDGQLFIRDEHTYWNFFQRYQRTSLSSPSMDPKISLLFYLPLNTAWPVNSFYFTGIPVVSGLGPFTYQWFKDGLPIAGANQNFFSIYPVQISDAGKYSVVVSNATGSVETVADTLTVGDPQYPSITVSPVSQTVSVGGSVTLSSVGTGTPTPVYQWKKDGVNVAGAVGSSYTIANVGLSDAGSYTVVATNSSGSITSNVATLAVQLAPVIVEQPASQTAGVSFPVTFRVRVNSGLATTYQWRKNGINMNGATGTSYTIGNLNVSDAGTYSVAVSNTLESVTSNGAVLNVVAFNPNTAKRADFNGDGKVDILWEDAEGGSHGMWLMNGTGLMGWVDLGQVPPPWHMVAAADFNGDGKTDILWEDTEGGSHGIWLMNGTAVVGWVDLGQVPPPWHMVAAADFNGDGKTDILWEDGQSGSHGVWLMNGTAVVGWADLGQVPPPWHIVAAADFNGDGKTDILWEEPQSGSHGVWLMNGTAVVGWADLGQVPPPWHMVTTGDFNGDGKTDILWEEPQSGSHGVWLMNGTAVIGWADLGQVPAPWHIVP